MGEHRGGSGARGISKGPILGVAAAVLVVGGFFGWKALGERIDDQGQQAAGTCVEGAQTVDVTADPSIAPQIEELGKRYTQTSPVVRDHCISVAVHGASSAATGAALAAGAQAPWDDASLGPRPTLWIPTSTYNVAPLVGKSVINGDPRSLATSPVVLAVSPTTATELTDHSAGWTSLPADLVLALPAGSTETAMAAQAVAADTAGVGSGPVTTEHAKSARVTAALTARALQFQSLPSPPATTADALAALAAGAADSAAAVPATEQAIAQSADEAMTAYSPAGSTPVADYPAVIVAGSGIDETASRAAAQFADFMRDPIQSQLFVGAGFRVDGQDLPELGALPPAKISSTLVPASAEAAAVVDGIVANPVSPRSTTVLMDASASMGTEDGGSTRLAAVAAALNTQLSRSPDSSDIGLHQFGPDGSAPERTLVAGGALSEQNRRETVPAALNALRASGKSTKYPALAAAYKAAVDGFDAGRTNSVLLITSGTADESTTTRTELLSAIAAAGNPARPVRVDVIVIGPSPDESTLQDVSDRTGGSLVRVDSASAPALATAVTKMLS